MDVRVRRIHPRQGALIDEAFLYQWPNAFSSDLFTGPGNGDTGDSSQWFGSSRTSAFRRADRGKADNDYLPEIELGSNDLAVTSNNGFGDAGQWVAASSSYRRNQRTGSRQWTWSFPERIPDLPEEMLIAVSRMGVHSLPVTRRMAPTAQHAYIDPLEFRTIVAFDGGGTTLPVRGPVVRRQVMDNLAFGVFVTSPEITANIVGDVTNPARLPLRIVRGFTQDLPLNSDFLGPLPATFVFSPQSPRLLVRGPFAATDGTLRDLPDSMEAIFGVWHTQPQVPTKSLLRAPLEGAGSAGGVWFNALQVEVFTVWSETHWQQPARQLERRRSDAASAFDTHAPLGDPMAWDVGHQPGRMPRSGRSWQSYAAVAKGDSSDDGSPNIFSGGVSITVLGPYWAVQGAVWAAGAVAGVVVTE